MHVCLASKSDAPAQPEEGEEKEEEKEAEPEIKGLFNLQPLNLYPYFLYLRKICVYLPFLYTF